MHQAWLMTHDCRLEATCFRRVTNIRLAGSLDKPLYNDFELQESLLRESFHEIIKHIIRW